MRKRNFISSLRAFATVLVAITATLTTVAVVVSATPYNTCQNFDQQPLGSAEFGGTVLNGCTMSISSCSATSLDFTATVNNLMLTITDLDCGSVTGPADCIKFSGDITGNSSITINGVTRSISGTGGGSYNIVDFAATIRGAVNFQIQRLAVTLSMTSVTSSVAVHLVNASGINDATRSSTISVSSCVIAGTGITTSGTSPTIEVHFLHFTAAMFASGWHKIEASNNTVQAGLALRVSTSNSADVGVSLQVLRSDATFMSERSSIVLRDNVMSGITITTRNGMMVLWSSNQVVSDVNFIVIDGMDFSNCDISAAGYFRFMGLCCLVGTLKIAGADSSLRANRMIVGGSLSHAPEGSRLLGVELIRLSTTSVNISQFSLTNSVIDFNGQTGFAVSTKTDLVATLCDVSFSFSSGSSSTSPTFRCVTFSNNRIAGKFTNSAGFVNYLFTRIALIGFYISPSVIILNFDINNNSIDTQTSAAGIRIQVTFVYVEDTMTLRLNNLLVRGNYLGGSYTSTSGEVEAFLFLSRRSLTAYTTGPPMPTPSLNMTNNDIFAILHSINTLPVCFGVFATISPATFTGFTTNGIGENRLGALAIGSGQATALYDPNSINVTCGNFTPTSTTTTTVSTTTQPQTTSTMPTSSVLLKRTRTQSLTRAPRTTALPPTTTSQQSQQQAINITTTAAAAIINITIPAALRSYFEEPPQPLIARPATAVTTTFALAAMPSAATSMRSLAAAASLAGCADSANRSAWAEELDLATPPPEEMGWDSNVFALQIGDQLPTYGGTVVSVVILCFGTWLLGYIFALLRSQCGANKLPMSEALRKLHHPSTVCLFSNDFCPPMMQASIVLVAHPLSNNGVLGICGIVLALLPLLFLLALARHFTRKEILILRPPDEKPAAKPEAHDSNGKKQQRSKAAAKKSSRLSKQAQSPDEAEEVPSDLSTRILSTVDFLTAPRFEYKKTPTVDRMKFFVENHISVYYAALDYGVALLISGTAGVAASCETPFCCQASTYAVAIFSLSYLAVLLIKKPLLVRFDAYNIPIMMFLTAATSILSIVAAHIDAGTLADGGNDVLAAIDTLNNIIFYLGCFALFLAVFANTLSMLVWVVSKCSSSLLVKALLKRMEDREERLQASTPSDAVGGDNDGNDGKKTNTTKDKKQTKRRSDKIKDDDEASGVDMQPLLSPTAAFVSSRNSPKRAVMREQPKQKQDALRLPQQRAAAGGEATKPARRHATPNPISPRRHPTTAAATAVVPLQTMLRLQPNRHNNGHNKNSNFLSDDDDGAGLLRSPPRPRRTISASHNFVASTKHNNNDTTNSKPQLPFFNVGSNSIQPPLMSRNMRRMVNNGGNDEKAARPMNRHHEKNDTKRNRPTSTAQPTSAARVSPSSKPTSAAASPSVVVVAHDAAAAPLRVSSSQPHRSSRTQHQRNADFDLLSALGQRLSQLQAGCNSNSASVEL